MSKRILSTNILVDSEFFFFQSDARYNRDSVLLLGNCSRRIKIKVRRGASSILSIVFELS